MNTFHTVAGVAVLKQARSSIPRKREVAIDALSNAIAHLEDRTIHPDCHGATLKLQKVSSARVRRDS